MNNTIVCSEEKTSHHRKPFSRRIRSVLFPNLSKTRKEQPTVCACQVRAGKERCGQSPLQYHLLLLVFIQARCRIPKALRKFKHSVYSFPPSPCGGTQTFLFARGMFQMLHLAPHGRLGVNLQSSSVLPRRLFKSTIHKEAGITRAVAWLQLFWRHGAIENTLPFQCTPPFDFEPYRRWGAK